MSDKSLKEPDLEERAPLDYEIFLLRAGLRQLVKKERVPTRRVDEVRAFYEDMGLHAACDTNATYDFLLPDDLDYQAQVGEYTTIFLAESPEVAARGIQLERFACNRSKSSGGEFEASVREIGSLLGYPSCCVEAYIHGLTRHSSHGNIGGYYLAAYHRTTGSFNSLLNPFSIGNPHIRHFPCSYNCEASLKIARAVRAELAKRDPKEAARQEALFSRPTIFWHPNRLVAFTGTWEDAVFRYEKAEYYDGDGYYPTEDWDEAYAPLHQCLKRGDGLAPRLGSVQILSGDEVIGGIEDLDPLCLPYFFNWDAHWYPYDRQPSVAMVDLHATTEDYFGSPPALLGGDLRKQGINTELYFGETGHKDTPEIMAKLEKLCDTIVASGCQVVVAARCLSPPFFSMLGERGIRRVLVSAGGNEPLGAVDMVLEGQGDQSPRALRGQGRVSNMLKLMGLFEELCAPRRSAAPTQPHLPPDLPLFCADLKTRAQPFNPILEYTPVPGLPQIQMTRWYLYANGGCPFSKVYSDPEQDKFLPTLSGGRKISLRGCNFCDMGGDYKRVEWRADLGVQMANQIHAIVSTSTTLKQFIVGDTYPFPYLPDLVETLIEKKVQDVEILVQSRPDWFLKNHPRIIRLFPKLSELRVVLVFYLIGFENFSQAELDRMDKGMTVAQNLETIRVLRRLEDEYPRCFTATAHKSHGFLLFNPWTTLDDLEENARVIREVGFHEFRSHFLLTRLRLYPHLPVFHKAVAEGLMLEAYDRPEKSSSRRVGYAPEFPWRARDPGTDRVFELVSALHDEVAPRWHGDLLGWAVSFVRANTDSEDGRQETDTVSDTATDTDNSSPDLEERFRAFVFSEKLPELKSGVGRIRSATEQIRASRRQGVATPRAQVTFVGGFGPLALGHEIIPEWPLKSLRWTSSGRGGSGDSPRATLQLIFEHKKANCQLVFLIEESPKTPDKSGGSRRRKRAGGGSRGPFDAGPIRIRYMRESEAFQELMPAGKALRALFEEGQSSEDYGKIWSRWKEESLEGAESSPSVPTHS